MKRMRKLKHCQSHGQCNIDFTEKKLLIPGELSIPQIWDKKFIIYKSIIYESIVYWKNNQFHISPSQALKRCTQKETKLMNEWLHYLPMNDISFKTITIILSPLLQRRWKFSKSKYHLKSLQRRMKLYNSADQAETIQKSFKTKDKT